MPPDDLIERLLQCLNVEHSLEAKGSGYVIGIGVWLKFGEQPESLLRIRQRQRSIARNRLQVRRRRSTDFHRLEKAQHFGFRARELLAQFRRERALRSAIAQLARFTPDPDVSLPETCQQFNNAHNIPSSCWLPIEARGAWLPCVIHKMLSICSARPATVEDSNSVRRGSSIWKVSLRREMSCMLSNE